MLLTHLHALGRNSPDRLRGIQIELLPTRIAQLTGPNKHQRRKLQRRFG